MKKILIFLGAFFFLAAAGLGFFVITFDANRYRSQAAKALSDALGCPVSIGQLSLGWRQGAALEIKKLAIFKDQKTMNKPAVYLERASVRVRIFPLLSKKIDVISVLLVHPKLNVIREAGGSIKINGINSPTSRPAEASSRTSQRSAVTSFFVGSIGIEGAEIGFVDRSQVKPIQVAVHRLDILIKNLSFSDPVDFQANMALFSAKQNLKLRGRVRVMGMAGPYLLEDFRMDADLGSIDLRELKESVPALENAGFREGLSGRLSGAIERLKIEGKGMSNLDATLNLKGGKVIVESLRAPLENMEIKARVTENAFELHHFSAEFARGDVRVSGVSKNYMSSSPQSTVDLKVSQISLAEVLPAETSRTAQLYGNFSAGFTGQASGLSWPAISKTLNGNGEVSLNEGVVINLNILRAIFDQMSQIPGVASVINKQLPPYYRQMLDRRDTQLPPIKFPVQIINGVLMVPNLKIVLEGFELYVAGRISLEGAVDCQATFMMEPELTALIANSAPQIQYIVDANGRLAIPVRIVGDVRHLRIEPDMDYVLSRVVENKGKELISDVLQKAINKNQQTSGTSGASAVPAAAPEEPTYKNMLGKLLQQR